MKHSNKKFYKTIFKKIIIIFYNLFSRQIIIIKKNKIAIHKHFYKKSIMLVLKNI